MARVVVIGAGVGGLACAARLSVKRHNVTVLEQGELGGKLAAFAKDGFVFDTGPSLLTLPAVYRDLFLKTGTALEECVDLLPVEPGFHYHFADSSAVTLPGVGTAAWANAFGLAFGPEARTEWLGLMNKASQMWQLTRRNVLEAPLGGARDLLSLARHPADIKTIMPWRSMSSFGQHELTDPRLRMIFNRYATYTGSLPTKAPAVLATIPFIEAAFGAWHIRGGISQLTKALVARCEERKVTMRPHTPAVRIETNSSGVHGVTLADGSTIPADVVVANCDARNLYQNLVAADPRATAPAKRLSRAPSSYSGLSIMLAVAGSTPGIGHHNVWFPERYPDEFTQLGRGVIIDDPAIYACVPADHTMRPEHSEAWFILVNAPRHGSGPGSIDWTEPGLAERYADRIIDMLAQRGCDLRGRIQWRTIRTPADIEHDSRSPGGAIYGTSRDGMRASFARAANQSPIPGLFLVGGSAHPGGGLPLVGMSAEIVANLIGRG